MKYQIYHNTFTSAVKAVTDLIKNNGFEYDEDEFFEKITVGPGKPAKGKTFKATLSLFKNGKEQRKAIHFQVYAEDNRYELNCYIS